MSRRALVVDDSRATRSILRRLLEPMGFDVLEAGHGREALAQLEAHGAVELVLVDWNMPEMDGLELIRAVRADSAYERVLLMMITSENDPVHITRALMAGADEYALKPLTPDALVDKLSLIGIAT